MGYKEDVLGSVDSLSIKLNADGTCFLGVHTHILWIYDAKKIQVDKPKQQS